SLIVGDTTRVLAPVPHVAPPSEPVDGTDDGGHLLRRQAAMIAVERVFHAAFLAPPHGVSEEGQDQDIAEPAAQLWATVVGPNRPSCRASSTGITSAMPSRWRRNSSSTSVRRSGRTCRKAS